MLGADQLHPSPHRELLRRQRVLALLVGEHLP
jgi:hypothetical protein